MNEYLSKYSKYQTHFERVDQWSEVQFQDDEDIDSLTIVLSVMGFIFVIASIFALLWM
jgi:hypothetical protein